MFPHISPSFYNHTDPQMMWYVLTGIPGLEDLHTWISIPICSMYIVAVVGNIFLIFLIVTESSLHEPMYLFLSMLALADVLLSTTTAPKMLAIFWSHSMNISFASCVSQMFFIHFIFATESAILLAMAFDRYVAICYPLRYTTILTSSVIGKIGIAAVIRSFIICFPFIFLVYRLTYCGRNIIAHSYCEHMGIARLACDSINVNIIYGLTVALLSTGLDVVFIITSYTMILLTVFRIPSWAARCKAFNTCGSHICVILMFYAPAFFSFFAHRFGGKTIPHHIHILIANLYVVVPPMLNPIIYGVKTKQIQDRVILLFSSISICC
ncbi:olfactory receptor 52Z1-like [Rousettus aegyptiacus]|uniref:Olfactory receptor n=1 Tax=Rousettus aegyptiacus TaxID=9407 RepID=A0A7J8H407_ROUAE|nr:olfactory receptor 52Z1-like [Rousettus aegyptiacus]KAF6466830.1 olfactory receptor family 52 subfamily Z member 1 [Rousettus aegyptiacus]